MAKRKKECDDSGGGDDQEEWNRIGGNGAVY